jgi:outer membrane protein TolC
MARNLRFSWVCLLAAVSAGAPVAAAGSSTVPAVAAGPSAPIPAGALIAAAQPPAARAAAPAAEPAPAAPPAAPAPVPVPTPTPAPPSTPGEMERLNFRQAIDRTLARNPTIQQAVAEVLRAEALVMQARANSLPQITLNAQYTRIGEAITFGNQMVTPVGVTTANGTFATPVINLAAWAQWAHAIDNRKIAELSALDVKRRVALAAANAYLAVIARHRVLEAQQRALDTARAHLDVTHQRLEGGIASRLDDVQAGQDSANDEVLVEQATLALHRAQEALGVLVAGDAPVDAVDEPAFEGVGSITEAFTGLEARRTDVQLQSMRQIAAERVLRDSVRDYFPVLNFTFQQLFVNPANLFQPANSWQALIQLSVPLYDSGLRQGLRHERRALVQEAQANFASTEVQARSDVRIAWDSVGLADQGLAAARNAARQAHEALDITNLSYGAGASTSLDILDAERRARDADTAVATAEDAARQARLDLLAASGRFP